MYTCNVGLIHLQRNFDIVGAQFHEYRVPPRTFIGIQSYVAFITVNTQKPLRLVYSVKINISQFSYDVRMSFRWCYAGGIYRHKKRFSLINRRGEARLKLNNETINQSLKQD